MKLLILSLTMMFLSNAALATKARLEGLGEDKDESFYIADTRGIFTNPAFLNQYKDYMVFEWGLDDDTAIDSSDSLLATTPGHVQAEGGFFRSAGKFAYGLYLGREVTGDKTMRDLAEANTTTISGLADQDNPIELFLAGDAAIQWGVGLRFTHSSDETPSTYEKTHESLKLSFGTISGSLQTHLNLFIVDRSEGDDTDERAEYEADLGGQVGAVYTWDQNSAWAKWRTVGFEAKNQAGAKDMEYTNMSWELGWGRISEITDRTRLFTSVSLDYYSVESRFNQASTNSQDDNTEWKMPFQIGFETDAREWLTLRGSYTQNIISEHEDSDKNTYTVANSGNVTAGATLNLGSLKIDGLVGTDRGTGASPGTDRESGILTLDNFMTRVAVHYWF